MNFPTGICIFDKPSRYSFISDLCYRYLRLIILPPVAEPRAEERGLRAQCPIELPRPRFGCADLFAGEGVDALAADAAQRIYILQRNARRALALVCQGIAGIAF